MWKQPIPVNIEELEGNPFRRSIFQHLLLRAANNDKEVYVSGAYIPLKRGQCILGRFEFAAEFGLFQNEALRVYRELKKLEKVNKLVNIQKSRNCSIVTILNYDTWVLLEQSNEQTVNKQRTNSEQTVNTNKSVKNVKSVKIVKNTPSKKKSKESILTVDFYKTITSSEAMKKYYLTRDEYDEQVERMLDYYEAKGKTIKSYPAAMRNWLKSAGQYGHLRVNEFNSITSIA